MEAIITVGISACGKSTFAGMIPNTEINRDDLRFGVVRPDCKGWKDYKFKKEDESRVTREQLRLFNEAAENGEDIIISDTNINQNIRKKWILDSKAAGYNVTVIVFNVDLKEAIERDSYRRGRSVGEKVITEQYDRLQKQLTFIENESHIYGYNLVCINN